ncbi:MAG: Dabb family protein [Tabrizicola sp.]|nr:Dabb family protein [Tabrizicola sp.]
MIRHIVPIRFRDTLDEEAAEAILGQLSPLSRRLGFCCALGRSESPEHIERGYLHGFIADFASWSALAACQEDAGHTAFGARLVSHAEGGLDGILVFDLAFQPAPAIT